ncbi:hypothetical protein MSSAC_2782 [Methanosarcina siciliae C2J]|uniref:Uncharacterized protein n=1 Tax=Methanosarcina siciliae C2J TaxID=1434118 RepID=A0A0E3PRP4_9EURY|nr:hypothetical protein MSSAC_2782 [Methanosarcina siciliae C2J]
MLKLDPMITRERLLMVVIASPYLVRDPVWKGIALMFMNGIQAIEFNFFLTAKMFAECTYGAINDFRVRRVIQNIFFFSHDYHSVFL